MPYESTAQAHHWTAPGNKSLELAHWSVGGASSPRLRLLAIHGLGGCAGDFEPLARRLAEQGIETFALNLRGQGCDPKRRQRGHFRSVDQWLADVNALAEHLLEREPACPLILAGESLGAVLLSVGAAQDASALSRAQGLLLLAPVPYVEVSLTPRQIWLTRWLIRLFPRVRLSPGLFTRKRKADAAKPEPHPVSRLPEYRQWLESAPHRVRKFSLRFLGNVWQLIDACPEAAKNLKLPVLQLCAGCDLFIDQAQSRRFFEQIGSTEKQFACWPEACHLLLHDPDTPEVLDTIESWIRRLDIATKSASSTANAHH
ncbi:MAG: alpha/beta fold hydrolase [Opitutales bacterium]